MKKFFLPLALSFFLFFAETVLAGNLYGDGKARTIYAEIKSLKGELGGYRTECENLTATVEVRLNSLGDGHFLDFFADLGRGECLRSDVLFLEEELNKVAVYLPYSAAACEYGRTQAAVQKIRDLRAEILCLRRYGGENDTAAAERQGCYGYYDPAYLDSQCKSYTFYNAFRRLDASWRNLQETLKSLEEGADWTVDRQGMQSRANRNAREWVNRNLNLDFSGKNFVFGWDWLTKSEQKGAQKAESAQKSAEPPKIPPPSPTGADASAVFAVLENNKTSWQFAKDLADGLTAGKIFRDIDMQITADLEKPLTCLQYSLERVASSEAETTPIKGCADPITQDPKLDGLKEKTKALKALLDAHNQ